MIPPAPYHSLFFRYPLPLPFKIRISIHNRLLDLAAIILPSSRDAGPIHASAETARPLRVRFPLFSLTADALGKATSHQYLTNRALSVVANPCRGGAMFPNFGIVANAWRTRGEIQYIQADRGRDATSS